MFTFLYSKIGKILAPSFTKKNLFFNRADQNAYRGFQFIVVKPKKRITMPKSKQTQAIQWTNQKS